MGRFDAGSRFAPPRFAPPRFALGAGAFAIALTGLTEGAAAVGDVIGYTITPDNGTEAVAWGSTPGGSEYGTGSSPSAFTAGTLYLSVTDGGETVQRAVPARDRTAPTFDLNISAVGRVVTLSVDNVAGFPTPAFDLTLLDNNADDVLSDATGVGPWSYVVPSARIVSAIVATVTGMNSEGSQDEGASLPVAADLAPLAQGLIADQTYTVGIPITGPDVAADFLGDPLTFALAPSSAALSWLGVAADGTLSGTPDATVTDAIIVIRATNTDNALFADSAYSVTVEAAPVAPLITAAVITGDQTGGDLPLSLTISGAATARGWSIFTGAAPATPAELSTAPGVVDSGTVDLPADGVVNLTIADGLKEPAVNVAFDRGDNTVIVATGGPRAIDTQKPEGSLSAASTGQTTADVTLTLTLDAGDFHNTGIWPEAATPSIDDIRDGVGAIWHSADNVAAVGANLLNATGLTAGEAYRAWSHMRDAQGNFETLVSASFTTDAASSPLVASQIGGIWDILNNNTLDPAVQDVAFVSAVPGREVMVNGVFLQVGGTGFTVAVTADPDGAQPTPVTVNTIETSLSNGGACMSFWFAAPDAQTYRISVTPITNNWRKGKAEIFDIQNRTAYSAVENSPSGAGVVDLSANVATGDLVTVGNCQVDSNDDGVVEVGFSTYNFFQDLAGSRAAGLGHHIAAAPENPRPLSIEWISANERSTLRTKVS